jgi:hypothetical protein
MFRRPLVLALALAVLVAPALAQGKRPSLDKELARKISELGEAWWKNTIALECEQTRDGAKGVTLFLDARMIDPASEVVVTYGGAELYRGKPEPDVWTVLETLDDKLDRSMVFDRRIEL